MKKLGYKKIGNYVVYFLFDVDDDGDVSLPYPYMSLIKEYYEVANQQIPNRGVTIDWVDGVIHDVNYEVEQS